MPAAATTLILSEVRSRYQRLSAIEEEIFDAMESAAAPIHVKKKWLTAEEIFVRTTMFCDIEALVDQLRSMRVKGLLYESAGKWQVVW